MENYKVVIPAAGQGKRMKAGQNKQFLLLDQTPLLIHTLRVFEGDVLCESIILVVNEGELEEMRTLLLTYGIKKVEQIVLGGQERQHSVYEGLKALDGNPIVLIHDGARPFIQQSEIHKLVETVVKSGSATIGTPAKDTMKLVVNGKAVKTVERSSLWAVQTPQAFRLADILYAHKKAELDSFMGTDDASLLEFIGEKVTIVEGNYENIKLTTPEDIIFGEAIIKRRKGERNGSDRTRV
ncbi:2-C-methyl-D-erythritol 4-phosphate cytidylyltransferase [Evansella tamaricis]|uniref:2-C-methyl-D-erythritol 4-phosphate cytidylyltransferase n=1 Tax=Evansella tamaricis TaxID=2069301 RepID=A0ABS6JAX1_9BACI|nr:2-C-methyl-D-erythritol 4-phosphate cytidylyltransferase [Evansella tamaricis]MBU9710834.1 2-C-methyl-D-erythritol 4-phosphate cytidylyltransferase [Evansella tamaricis]